MYIHIIYIILIIYHIVNSIFNLWFYPCSPFTTDVRLGDTIARLWCGDRGKPLHACGVINKSLGLSICYSSFSSFKQFCKRIGTGLWAYQRLQPDYHTITGFYCWMNMLWKEFLRIYSWFLPSQYFRMYVWYQSTTLSYNKIE